MDLSGLNFFQMTQKKLGWLNKRQAVVSQNLANANTPGYVAKDIKPLNFKDELAKTSTAVSHLSTTNSAHVTSAGDAVSAMMITNPKHIGGGAGVDASVSGGMGKIGNSDGGVYETSIDGNGVVLEEQMAKLGEIQHEHELALTLFKKNVNLLKIAIGKK
ncbi:MAG: flagellar biosynthesis protein FlgB [Alphaproteobacteria bacterium]|nr:flagellar biosynthesis protein FlgB [Alphaproteobacteria bacterium]